jgi:hypothetical protein
MGSVAASGLAVAVVLALTGCSGAGSTPETGSPDVADTSGMPATSAAPGSSSAPEPSASAASEPSASAGREPSAADDPVQALTGRAVEGLADKDDAILRIGAPGWALPDEAIFDVFGDRVLSAVAGEADANARLRIRDLAGNVIREIDAGFNLPQTGIVRGDDVIYAGVQFPPDKDPFDNEDRGVWIAHGDRSPERIVDPSDTIVYRTLVRSPDGRTIGAEACGEACRTLLVPDAGEPRVIDRPGLDALTDDTAVFLASWSGIAGVGVDDGVVRWTHDPGDGVNWGRYATADGRRIVHATSLDGEEPGSAGDVFRIEVIDGTSGEVERTIDIPIDEVRWGLAPELSTDRYGVLLSTVLPKAEDAPVPVRVVDLADGETLDIDLELQPIGGT